MLGLLRKWIGQAAGRRLRERPAEPRRPPTVFHVTHWKAGSQWLNKILSRVAGDRVVFAERDATQLLARPVQPGKVYTTCYVTRQEFDRVPLPRPWHRFVVIRDLRDTLVSFYFSLKISHVSNPVVETYRSVLRRRELEDGLLYLLDDRLPGCAAIQRSWLEAGEELIRYEDLLQRDEAILVPLLTEKCPLGVPDAALRAAIAACRFEALTGGRSRGQEDVGSHERKGVAGDWRNHFTSRVTREFKARFGELLVATGYEKDLNW
jgi:Sulfotransferase domain